MQNINQTPGLSHNKSIPELESLALKAANTFRPFLGPDGFSLESYKKFLNTMYHYTSRSGEMIRHAGALAHTEELKGYFGHMLREEKSHYILAKEDLKELGDEVSKEIPRSVRNFHANWLGMGSDIHPYLGAIYVFENIAKHLQSEGKVFFERLGLSKKQRRWVAVHLEADLVHGDEIIDLCSRYFDENPQACLYGGKLMCESWMSVFTDFKDHP